MLKSDLKFYFSERLIEIFDNSTLDSYRVRVNNTLTLLIEARDTINGRIEDRIKSFLTVRPCLEELVISLKQDDCLTYTLCNKEKTIQLIRDFIGKDDNQREEFTKYPFILFIINRLIRDNQTTYLSNLFQHITDILTDNSPLEEDKFEQIVNRLDLYILSMGCQLINNGYSKTFLFYKAKELSQNCDFINGYDLFKNECLVSKKKNYYVVLKVNISERAFRTGEVSDFTKEIDDEKIIKYLSNYSYLQSYIKGTKHSRFYISKESALDEYSAMKNAAESLATVLDQINLGMTSLKATALEQGLAVSKNYNGHYSHKYGKYYRFDGKYFDDIEQVVVLQDCIKIINSNAKIKDDVKDRLTSAFRHLRIANYSMELEEKFLNFWIALEFLFSSPLSNETTFERLKNNLSNILYCCYAKRNLEYLNDILHKKGIIQNNEDFWKKSNGELDNLIISQTSMLIKYRLIRLKNHFLTNEKQRRDYMEQHLCNLRQHITRIYRLRNELVHEAAIKQSIENMTSNLRYYLVFTLNQMLSYFSTEPTQGYTMDDFFNEYKLLKIKLSQENNLTANDLINIPLEHRLLIS